MRRIQLNSAQLNAVRLNGIGECQRVSHAGAPPVVPDVPDIPDIPEEPDVPSDPDVDEDGYIIFADPEVKRVLLANGVGDGVGITKEAAAEVTSIGTWFKGNADITSFAELAEFRNVQTLEFSAFNGAVRLENVDLHNMRKIGKGAFFNCTSLTIETLDLPNLTYLGNGAFNSTKIQRIKSLGMVTSFEDAALNVGQTFQSCVELTSIEQSVLDKLTYLAEAFKGCTNLRIEKLRLPALTGTITAGFNGCDIVDVVDLGKITKFFGDNTLGWAAVPFGYRYRSVILPASVESIGRYAFSPSNNTNLAAIIVKPTTPPSCAASWATNLPAQAMFYVPDTSVEAYKTATNWSAHASRILPVSQLATNNPELYAEIEEYL